MSNKKEIRVFLSSTFKDLDEERAYLSKHTFPLLRTYCNRKGVHFSEIDLRWGLTEEDSKNGRVLRLCLDQIHDCKPFFIGILGSRYGWIPTMSDLQKDRQLKENYPDLQASIQENRSVVEIEFEQGMLNDPQPEYQFVYAKQQEKRNPRVEELLGRVREKELMISEFSSLEQLHGSVLYDLQRAVDRYLEEANTPWADEDQLAFMTERLRSYIEHEGYSQKVDDQLSLERSMTIVTGDSGTGKSALMAHTIERLRQDTNKIVLGHFVGASPASRNSRGIFDHLAEQLKRNYEIDLGSTSTFSSLQDEFAFLLSKINDRGAVIIIDALDQLDEDSQPLDWLPEYLPENVHILVSTTPGPILKRLRQREWDEFAMEPFDREEREAFVVRYLADYGKSLSSDHVSSIAANPKCRNPLFLKMLLEEVRLSAHFTNLDETIDHYLSVKDLDGLFQLMLERLEEQFSREFIERFFSGLAVAHTGLSIAELAAFTKQMDQHVQHFLQTNAHFVFKVASRYSLFHQSLTKAVRQRYFAEGDAKRCASQLVDCLVEIGDSTRLTYEGVSLALDLDDEEVLTKLFTEPEIFAEVTNNWDAARPSPQASRILKHANLIALSRSLLAIMESREHNEDQLIVTRMRIANWLNAAGYFGETIRILSNISIDSHAEARVRLEIYNSLGTANQELDLLTDSISCYDHALKIARNELAGSVDAELEILQNLGIAEFYQKNTSAAMKYFEQALQLCERTASYFDERLGALSNIGAVLYSSGDYVKADIYLSKALNQARAKYDRNDPRLIRKLNNLGLVHHASGNFNSAINLLEESLRIARQCYGPKHLDVSQAMLNIGRVRESQQQYELAIQLYRQARNIQLCFLPPEHAVIKNADRMIQRVCAALES